MNCDEVRERLMDVLYGEEVGSREVFEFFKHADRCEACEREYLELVETRERLREWEVKEQPQIPWISRPRMTRVWPRMTRIYTNYFLKAAAGVLIVAGMVSVLQYVGLMGGRSLRVSEEQLVQTVSDLIVARQEEERRLIGLALVRMTEETDLRRRDDMREVYEYLVSLEKKYLENLEENNRYLRTLVTR